MSKRKEYTFWCEWDMGISGPWYSKEKMIADLREQHKNVFEGDPDYEDFDQCVAEGYYSFKEVK